MAITSNTYKYERPKSVDDSNYTDFEYLIAWYGADGSYLQKMFTDWNENYRVNTQPINTKDEDNIRAFIENEDIRIDLVAENLNSTDYTAMKSILKSSRIIRVYTDGTFDYLAIDSSRTKIRKTDLRYNIEFTLVERSKPIAN